MTAEPTRTMVVFDLGGVIVRICRSLEEACRAAGLPFHAAVAADDRSAERRALHARYELGRIDCEEFFDGLAATTGGVYSAENFRAIHRAWLLGEYPRVGPLIDELHAAGHMTGILSNTNAGHWRTLTDPARFPAIARVQHPHASHMMGVHKPDPGVYRAFEAAAGVQPASIIFFDDLLENVEAARACGWRAGLIDHAGDTAAQMRKTLRELHVL